MAIIYSYPRATNVESSDLLLICDSSSDNKATQTTTISDAVKSALVQGIELPADDPESSVQFNLGGNLTGIPTFTFVEDVALGQNILSLGAPIGSQGSRRGLINLYNRGRIALWASDGGGSNQAVALTGPRTVATSNPGSYEISLPTEDPSLNDGFPALYEEPRVWVINGDPLDFRQHDSQFMKMSPAFGDAFQLQFRKPNSVDPVTGDPIDNSGMFDATQQLRVIPLPGSATEITQGLSLSIGSVSRTSSIAPQKGALRIGSGPVGTGGDPNYFGGTVLLEYAYPDNGPITPDPVAAAYSFVGLRAPKYDDSIGIVGNINNSIAYQDYDLILPQLNPEYSTNNQPYEDASSNNISQLLIVNPVDVSNNGQRFYETKFVSVDNLDIGAAGVNNNVQFNIGNKLHGDNSFNFYVNNGGTGAPASSPNAHELQIGAGGGTLPGMLTLFGDNDPVENPNGGTAGILRFVASTGVDYATITGPSIQTEFDLTNQGTGYVSGSADSIFETEYVNQGASVGTGLTVHIGVQTAGPIQKISIHRQGHSYQNGDVLRIKGGDNNAEITLTDVRVQNNNDKQIYDLKLPKFPPNEQKIFFGTGTGKQANLTTSGFFKVREETGPVQSGLPTQGTTIQLQIGNPTSTGLIAEPYGSILLNGGDNTAEGGAVRFISGGHKTQWVNLIGPPGYSSNNLQPAPDPYSIMLPQWSPDTVETMFPDLIGGISGLESPPQGGFGQSYVIASRLPTETDSVNGIGCRVNIISTTQSGGISEVSIHTPGHGYQVGDTLTVVQSTNKTADIEITAIQDVVGGKVLVAAVQNHVSQGANNNKQMKWVAPSDLGITGGSGSSDGFAPLPIYQGDTELPVESGEVRTYIVQTVCDNGGIKLNNAKFFSSATSGSANTGTSVQVRCAVYKGQLSAPNGSQLVAFGTLSTVDAQSGVVTELTEGIHNIDINLTGTNGWQTVAGEPIIVVWEIENSSTSDMAILGSSFTLGSGTLITEGAVCRFLDGDPILDELGPTSYGDPISNEITGASNGTLRPCTHFIP